MCHYHIHPQAHFQPRETTPTDLIRLGPEEQQVEGNGCHNVYQEPALEVVDGDLARVAHHLIVLVHVGRAEVDEDVDDEHDVDDEVDDGERLRVAALHRRPGLVFLLLGQQEGGGVGREDGRVDDE